MKHTSHSAKGFTLIELMVTVLIIAILAKTAITSYLNYTRRSYYVEVVLAAEPYKLGIILCYQTIDTLTGCTNGANQVPSNLTISTGAVRRIRTANGVITVTPNAAHGVLTTDTYILTPRIKNNTLIWTTSGGGVTNGYTQ